MHNELIVYIVHSQTGWWLEPLVSLVFMLCDLR